MTEQMPGDEAYIDDFAGDDTDYEALAEAAQDVAQREYDEVEIVEPVQPTLPVVVFRLIGRPGLENQGMGMAAAVLLAVGCAVVMGLAERMRPEEATTW